jgi:hypothetical protein
MPAPQNNYLKPMRHLQIEQVMHNVILIMPDSLMEMTGVEPPEGQTRKYAT